MTHKHWDEFWEQGFITTFGSSFQNNYTGNLRHFWEKKFSILASGSKVLDLATGNGALACIAYSAAKNAEKSIEVYAIDAAQIKPEVDAIAEIEEARKNITFLSNTPCEDLPFTDNTFDFISSQFGIEYGSWNQSLPEVFRVLNQGASAHFICHSDSSSLIKSSQHELDIYNAALNTHQIFDHAIRFAELFALRTEQKSGAATTLNNAMNAFKAQAGAEQLCQLMVSQVSNALRLLKTSSRQKTVEALKNCQTAFTSAFLRQKDMLSAALGDADLAQLLTTARRVGFAHTAAETFLEDGKTIGTLISLTK